MGRNKKPNGASAIYSSHLYGAFNDNPAMARELVIERMYQRVLSELAINRFKWNGLPDSVNPRFLEKTLFYQALSVFFFDKRYDKFMALQGGGTNWLNYQQDPVGFSVIGAGSSNAFISQNVSAVKDTENAGMAIPIWANALRVPDLDIVRIYAHRLAKLDRTVEINSDNARKSKFIASNENSRLSMVNINRGIDAGENGIQISTNMAGNLSDFVSVLDLEVDPKGIETMDIVGSRVWNKAMALLGIENANQDKTERLVSAEVDANADQTSMMRYVNLNERKRAAERINDYYGLDVSVEYYTDEERRARMEDTSVNEDDTVIEED